MINWISYCGLSACFPFIINSKLELKGTFLVFSLITLIGLIFAFLFMKETKGKTELEIENDFK